MAESGMGVCVWSKAARVHSPLACISMVAHVTHLTKPLSTICAKTRSVTSGERTSDTLAMAARSIFGERRHSARLDE